MPSFKRNIDDLYEIYESSSHIYIKCLNDGILNLQNINDLIYNMIEGFPTLGWATDDDEEIERMRASRSWCMFTPDRSGSVHICGYFYRNMQFFRSYYRQNIETNLIKYLIRNKLEINFQRNISEYTRYLKFGLVHQKYEPVNHYYDQEHHYEGYTAHHKKEIQLSDFFMKKYKKYYTIS